MTNNSRGTNLDAQIACDLVIEPTTSLFLYIRLYDTVEICAK